MHLVHPTDLVHLAMGSDDCTAIIWHCHQAKRTYYDSFDALLNTQADRANTQQSTHSLHSAHKRGLFSSSKCVLRGHQSPIVAIALNSELELCVHSP